MRNLMVNAATHGKAARIGVYAEAENGHPVIEDDGPGIPEGAHGAGVRAVLPGGSGRQATIPGAGLGLAIAHENRDPPRGRAVLGQSSWRRTVAAGGTPLRRMTAGCEFRAAA